MRLIDADALMDAFRRYMAEKFDREKCVSEENCKTCERGCLWRKIVNNAPIIDAVEVVRCKDCRFYEIGVEYYGGGTKDLCRLIKCQMQEDDFCSYGERRDSDG